MNELIFSLHIIFIAFFLIISLKAGKAALTVYIVLLAVIANIFVVKQVSLFSLDVTSADVYVIGAILGLNFLQEYFGKKEAKKAVHITLGSFIFFLCMLKMHLFYQPNSFDTTQESFLTIFSVSNRIFIVSILGVYIVQWFSLILFSMLKKIFNDRYFHMRQFIALVCSQLLDTLLFSFLALWGVVENLLHIMVFSFVIKMIVIVASTLLIKVYSQKFHQATLNQ